MNSGLRYYGTQDDVRLGDRVMIERWFRRPLLGRVCYIPGISPLNRELEYDDVRRWAIRLDDGSFRVTGYFPGHRLGQPRGNIKLLSRGDGGELLPDERIEEE